MEHRQFIATDGSNRGLFSSGFANDTTKQVHMYEYYDNKRYNADIMDKAMRDVEKEMLREYGSEKKTYGIHYNNCQHYVDRVIKRAEEIARETNMPLVVN